MKSKLKVGLLAIASVLLAACDNGGDSSPSTPAAEAPAAPVVTLAEYSVTVTNLTAAQPLSPVAIVLHNGSFRNFTLGSPASAELELLAESGDNSDFLTAANDTGDVYGNASGTGIIAPGASETISLEIDDSQLSDLTLSLVTMLVNTNDAITSLDEISLSDLEVSGTQTHTARTYDSGTESNSETADTVPGPAADGGDREGFNAARDDVRDAVYVHAGAVTADDGLDSSTLSFIHRWDNPAIRVTIERLN